MKTPLPVVRYLAELDAALARRGAPDRDQVVAQVAEHIEEALAAFGPSPTGDQVGSVLTGLGDPLLIAGQSDSPEPEPRIVQVAAPKPPVLERGWVVPASLTLLLIAGAVCLMVVFGLAVAQGGDALVGAVTSVLVNPLWWASVVICVISPLFRGWEKAVWAVALPSIVVFEVTVIGMGGLLQSPYELHRAFGWVMAVGYPVLALGVVLVIAARAGGRARSQTDRASARPTGPAADPQVA